MIRPSIVVIIQYLCDRESQPQVFTYITHTNYLHRLMHFKFILPSRIFKNHEDKIYFPIWSKDQRIYFSPYRYLNFAKLLLSCSIELKYLLIT
jgi:hypothetical protein